MSGVFNAIGNVFNGIVDVVKSIVNTVVNVVSSVINFVASPFMGLLGGVPSMPDAGSQAQAQQGVLFQRQGSTEQIPIIYGLRKVGGIVTFAETGSDNNKYMWVAYVFSEGCVEGLYELFIDDFQLSADTVTKLNGGQIVDVQDGRYKDRCRMQWFPGQLALGGSNPVGTASICKDAPSWKSSMGYNGLSVLFARFEWKTIVTQADADANPYSGNIPKLQATILGRRIVSLAAGATPDPSQYEYDDVPGAGGFRGGLERYSTNPAEIILDYLRNPRYGKGLKNADIDWASFRVAAAKFNQTIQYTSAASGPILTTNVVLNSQQTIFQNVKLLLQGCRSYLPYVQGKYKLRVEDAGNDTDIMSGSATIVATFDRDSIQGDIGYTGIERSNKYNHVDVTWVDPDQAYSNQLVVYPETEAERQVYVTQDGGRENSLAVTLPTITNRQMALDMARLLFFKSRYQETCSLKVSSQAFELEPGDCIRIQSNMLNFGTTPWRVINIVLNNDYTFSLSCVRNPDWLFPYTKAGEVDRVLPPFRPYGSQSILPSNSIYNVGLIPPNTSIQTPGTGTNTTTNPPPTVVPLPSPTNPVPVVPVIPALIDKIDFTKATVTPLTADTVTITLEWSQPSHPQYDSIDLYYKPPSETGYRSVNVNLKPGSGKAITFSTPTVIAGLVGFTYYDFIARVKYSTGEYSTYTSKIQVNVSSITGITVTNPTEVIETTYAGWALPLAAASTIRSNVFGSVSMNSIQSGGSFTDPRSVSITLRQRFTASEPINDQIVGVHILYKPSNTTYWREKRVTVLNMVPGDDFTVTIGGTADTETVLGSPGTYEYYDWILRPLYKDGTSSSNQNWLGNTRLEYFGTTNFAYATTILSETVASRAITTWTQAVQQGSVVDAINSHIGVKKILDDYSGRIDGGFSLTSPAMRVTVNPPDSSILSLYRGFKVYLRPDVAGATPVVTNFINKSSILNGASGTEQYFDISLTGIGYNQVFEIIVVPLVYSGGAVVEGAYCQYGKGYINANYTAAAYPSTGNWASTFNFQEMATATALGTIATYIPQPAPMINITGWDGFKIQANEGYTPGLYRPSLTGTPYLNQVYRLTYSMSHITGFNELQIYRRRKVQVNSVWTDPYYYISRWEKVTLTSTSSGSLQVMLRPGTSNKEYSVYATDYAASGYKSECNTYGNITRANGYVWFEPALTNGDEFVFVVKANGAVSTKAIYLTGTTLTTTGVTNILIGTMPQIIDWTAGIGTEAPAGWEKRIADARTSPVAFDKLYVDRNTPVNDGNSNLISGGTIYTTNIPTTGTLGLY